MKLKSLLQQCNATQAELARYLTVSPATVAQLVNHDQWPRRMSQATLKQQITEFLLSRGLPEQLAITAFSEELSAKAVTSSLGGAQGLSEEDYIMLLRKQQLTPAAKQHFGLVRNPFDDVRSADEVFMTPTNRYVREAMRAAARSGGFLAVVGESGAGKSTLRRDVIEWINHEQQQVIVIEPYVLGMEDNDIKGKTLKAAHIAEAIMASVAPGVKPKRSPESRFRQVHDALRESHRAGNRHLLIIEEAHGLPIPTLKHLKRFFELEDGFNKLLSIILIGQSELAQKLDERNQSVREVVQRCEVVTLEPLDLELNDYLQHRFDLAGKPLFDVLDNTAIDALRGKLTGGGCFSVLYPLAIHNVLTAALNMACQLGASRITGELVESV